MGFDKLYQLYSLVTGVAFLPSMFNLNALKCLVDLLSFSPLKSSPSYLEFSAKSILTNRSCYSCASLSVSRRYYKRNGPVSKGRGQADYVAEVLVLASQSAKHAPTTPSPLIGSEKTGILDPSYELMKKKPAGYFFDQKLNSKADDTKFPQSTH